MLAPNNNQGQLIYMTKSANQRKRNLFKLLLS